MTGLWILIVMVNHMFTMQAFNQQPECEAAAASIRKVAELDAYYWPGEKGRAWCVPGGHEELP